MDLRSANSGVSLVSDAVKKIDFSEMSSTTIFSIVLLAVLAILLIILVIVTIKVLRKGSKEDDEYVEKKYTSRKKGESEDDESDEAEESETGDSDFEDEIGDSGRYAPSDEDEEQEDYDEASEDEQVYEDAPEEEEPYEDAYDAPEEDEVPEEDVEDEAEDTSEPVRTARTEARTETEMKDEVAAVVEAALQAKAKAAELEARIAREKAQQALEEAELLERKASEAEAEARAAGKKTEEPLAVEEAEEDYGQTDAPVEEEEEYGHTDELIGEEEEAEEEYGHTDELIGEEDKEEEYGHTDELTKEEDVRIDRVDAVVSEEKKPADPEVMKANTRVADAPEIISAVKRARREGKKAETDSAFEDSALVDDPLEKEQKKQFDTAFDSAFTDPRLNQDILQAAAGSTATETAEELQQKINEELQAAEAEEKTGTENKTVAEENTGTTPEIPVAEDSAFADSAFVSEAEPAEEKEISSLQVVSEKITVNPVNQVNIRTVNSVEPVNTRNVEAGINDQAEMSDFLSENPIPKKAKRKLKKRDLIFVKKFEVNEPRIRGAKYLWYNNQDIEALTKKEDMYYHCHYFNEPREAVLPLIIEMYDCAFVRTEEIQQIAYGIQYQSMGLREILTSKENVSFDRSKIQRDPTEKDLKKIREKWCEYVDNFLQIIVIQAPEDIQAMIHDELYAYGDNEVDTLLFCPDPDEEEE